MSLSWSYSKKFSLPLSVGSAAVNATSELREQSCKPYSMPRMTVLINQYPAEDGFTSQHYVYCCRNGIKPNVKRFGTRVFFFLFFIRLFVNQIILNTRQFKVMQINNKNLVQILTIIFSKNEIEARYFKNLFHGWTSTILNYGVNKVIKTYIYIIKKL